MPRIIVLGLMLVMIPAGMPRAVAQEATPSAAYTTPVGATGLTNLHYMLPYTTDTLNPGLIVSGTDSGTCIAQSLATPGRPDAWVCVGTATNVNLLYDPCFEGPFAIPEAPGDFACVVSPFASEVVLFTVAAPLPGAGPEDDLPAAGNAARGAGWDDAAAPLPWVLDLANGERCTLVSGAKALFAGMFVNYFCAEGGFVFGEPNRMTPLWMVRYVPPGGFISELIAVTDAWH